MKTIWLMLLEKSIASLIGEDWEKVQDAVIARIG